MPSPDDRVYSETHEWHKPDGDEVTIGLTRFAVDSLTDVTYVEMREPGTEVAAGDSVGEVESVKTTSDVYSSVGGVVAAVNEKLADDPGLVNNDPYGEGWLIRIKATDTSGLSGLKDAVAYDAGLEG